MNIKVGVSNRHIHLSEEDYNYLFPNTEICKVRDLSQDGEYVTNLVLNIKTDKSEIKNVRVVGPFREKTQVEISITDAYKLGINPPTRMSGNFDKAVSVILSSETNSKLIENSCIIANRHIHVNTKDLDKYNFYSGKRISVKINGDRGGVMNNVIIKVKDNYNLELHIDTDEANAFNLKNGDVVEITEGE